MPHVWEMGLVEHSQAIRGKCRRVGHFGVHADHQTEMDQAWAEGYRPQDVCGSSMHDVVYAELGIEEYVVRVADAAMQSANVVGNGVVRLAESFQDRNQALKRRSGAAWPIAPALLVTVDGDWVSRDAQCDVAKEYFLRSRSPGLKRTPRELHYARSRVLGRPDRCNRART